MSIIENSGARLAYSRTGAGSPVLLIQGVGLAGRAWEPQVAALTPAFTVVRFDNRGIGDSTYEGRALSIETMASDALAILDAERLDRVHVVGHSMGGVIAQELALAAPDRVRSLTLLCTFVRGKDAARLDWGMLWSGMRSRIGTRRGRRAAFLEMVVPPAVLREAGTDALHARLAELFGRDLADQPAIGMRQLRALARYDASERLGALSGIPTLVVSAELDRIARPRSGRALAAAIPGAAYAELSGAGHAVPAYEPATLNDVLLTHLVNVEERGRAPSPT